VRTMDTTSNGINDVMVVGEGGAIGRFNGVSWKKHDYAGRSAEDGLWGLSMKKNLAVGVRYVDRIQGGALVCIGLR
jgi:hypothetical protein